MIAIYRHDELCTLPGDKPNAFDSESAAEAYLETLLAPQREHMKRLLGQSSPAIDEGWEFREEH